MNTPDFCDAQDPFEDESAFVPQMMSGVFWISGSLLHKSRGGHVYRLLNLEQGSTVLDGILWPERRHLENRVSVPGFAFVTGWRGNPAFPESISVHSIRPLTWEDTVLASEVLPDQWCPPEALPALQELRRLERTLSPSFQRFVRSVLLDPQIAVPFMRCKGSTRWHDAFPGGLLVHSMKGMRTLEGYCQDFWDEDPDAWNLAFCARLFHDLGKILAIGERSRPILDNPSDRFLRHEVHSLNLLAPHWQVLEWEHPSAEERLKAMMQWMAMPFEKRQKNFPPKDPVLLWVARVDGESTQTPFAPRVERAF